MPAPGSQPPRVFTPPSASRAPAQPSDRRKPKLSGVEKLRDWNAEDLIACADAMGSRLQAVPVAQVRKFLGAVTRIAAGLQAQDDTGSLRDRVLLLKPRLAYVAARADADARGELRVRALFEDVSELADRVYEAEDFRRLHEYVQGVVAYHRFHGGRE